MPLDGLRSARELAEDKPHGTRIKYLGGCRCLPCRAASSRYEQDRARKRREGLGNGLVETNEVIAHLRFLSSKGVGNEAACDAAGIAKSSIQKVMSGQRMKMRAANARAILAITPEMAIRDGALISAGPTWRLIRWLMNEGMSKTEISRRLGRKRRGLQIGKTLVRASTASKIERMVNIMRIGE